MIAPSLPYSLDGIPKARDDVAQITLLVSNLKSCDDVLCCLLFARNVSIDWN